VEITDDLSYARTFYPRRSVRVYLNNLAQSVFNSLYKLKKDPFGNFIRFWKVSLPIEMYRARKHLLASFIVMAIAVLIGIVSTWDDIEFSRIILGDNYVDRTDEFIEADDPMAVYKQKEELPFFIELFLNNIRVSFFAFALGIVFCAGTGFILVSNGVMIGTFHTYFYLKELALGKSIFVTSLLTVWIHGTFEILGIVLSGAAGFVAGMSLLYPGTYTRLQSFQIGMKRGLKIMMGVTPFIFFAAILEGFVTRHTEMPLYLKLIIIFGSLFIFLFYFVFYPMYVYKKYEKEAAQLPEPVFRPYRKVELYKLKPVNEIIADSFLIFKEIYNKSAKFIWSLIIPLHLILAYFIFLDNAENMNYHNLNSFEILDNMLVGNGNNIYFFLAALLFSFSMSLSIRSLMNYDHPLSKKSILQRLKSFLMTTAIFYPFMLVFLSVTFIQSDLGVLLFFCILPLVAYFPVGINLSNKKGFEKLTYTWKTFFAQIGNSIVLLLVSILILGGIFFLVNSSVYFIIETLIEWHSITQISNYSLFINFIHTAVYFIFLHHFFIFLTLIFSLSHYVNTEIQESVSLFKKLKTFGQTSKTHEKFNKDEK